jgi:hypothetical protein
VSLFGDAGASSSLQRETHLIESGLLSAQLGTLTGTPVNGSAVPGTVANANLISSISSAKALPVDPESSPDSRKRSFRNSFEELTGPLTSIKETANPSATGKSANWLGKALAEPPNSLAGGVHAKDRMASDPSLSPTIEGVALKGADKPPVLGDQVLGDQRSNPQTAIQPASSAKQEISSPDEIEAASDTTKKTFVHTLTPLSQNALRSGSLNHRETSSLHVTAAKPANSKVTTKIAITHQLRDGATAALPNSSVLPGGAAELIQGPVQILSNQTSVAHSEASPVAADFPTPAFEAGPEESPPAVSTASSLQTQPGRPKLNSATASQTKDVEPTVEVVGQASSAIVQPAFESTVVSPGTRASNAPALAPAPIGTARMSLQKVPELPITNAPASFLSTFETHQFPLGPVSLIATPLGPSDAVSQNAVPASGKPISESPLAAAIATPKPIPSVLPASPADVPVAAKNSFTGNVSHPLLVSTEPSALDKPSPDKSASLSDSSSPVEVIMNFTQHSATQSQIPDFAVASVVTIPHVSPLPEIKQTGVASVLTATSSQNVFSSLSAPATGLDHVSSIEASSSGQHTTLLVTPNVLEVGVASGSHGWLKVRAELDGSGGVAASVTANSTSATETMHKDLPALSAYLSSESVGVSSLVVNQALAAGMATTGAATHGVSMDLGAGAGGGGSARDQAHLSQQPQPVPLDDMSTQGVDVVSARLDGGPPHMQVVNPGDGLEAGSWLSVRA